MKVVRNESNVFFDVDDTLVMWEPVGEGPAITIPCPHSTDSYYMLSPHEAHIKLLKNHKARGSHITVWSQSGYAWAEAVVKALGLEDYVDQVMTKPRAHIDDLPCTEWMGERIYLSPDSNYGRSNAHRQNY